jgi:hypothetical protein
MEDFPTSHRHLRFLRSTDISLFPELLVARHPVCRCDRVCVTRQWRKMNSSNRSGESSRHDISIIPCASRTGAPCPHCTGVRQTRRPARFGVGRRSFYRASDRDALLRPARLCGIELPIALFDAAGPLVSGNRGADMVRASAFACSGDFLLRLAGCQGKNLIVEIRRAAAAVS